MSGRLRYALAAAFVALFAFFPSADPDRIAFLQTRAWLTDEALAPFLADDAPAGLPPITAGFVSVGLSEEQSRANATELERALREWARGQDRATDASRPPLHVEIRVGQRGYRGTLTQAPEGLLPAPIFTELMHDPPEGVPPVEGAYYPDRFSLAPAFLAIILAILTGKVIPALLLGCLAGAWLFRRGLFSGIEHLAVDTIYGEVLRDQFHLEILGFVLFLFMSIGVMTRSGGVQGMVEVVSRFAKGPVSTQVASWVIGLLIFFDDYSNCIITGSTMRPLTDRVGVAREKLAYIVDSTAAPIAGISIFSTWVAYEVSMFAPQLPEVTDANGVAYQQSDGFSVFVQTLPVRFYCLFTIVMVLLTIVTRREFGPMLTAARRAADEGKPLADDANPLVSESLNRTKPPEGAPLRARNAVLPIVTLVVGTISLIFYFGTSNLSEPVDHLPWYEQASRILGGGESQRALCLAAMGTFLLSFALAVGQRILTAGEAMVAAIRSAKSLIFAMVILILAWAIGTICGNVGTATFLTSAFHASFDPWLLPAIMFALSSLVAFSTGTSYGTMAILLPNVVVLAHTMGQTDPNLGGAALMILTIGAVLEGSIFGDHCSPISDTTVLSSVATGSDHIHHVRTQAPYAVFVMVIAMVCGYLPTALFGPEIWPISWLAGGAAILGFLLFVGRSPSARVEHPA